MLLCDLPKDDKRYVSVSLGHLTVDLPKAKGEMPNVDGHVAVRAPIALVNRLPDAPDVDGWISLDAEVRYSPDTPIPDMTGRLEVRDARIGHYSFSRSITTDFVVQRSVVKSSLLRVEIAQGVNVRVVKAMIADVRNRTAIAANDAKS